MIRLDRFVLRHRRPSVWRLALPASVALLVGGSLVLNGGPDEWSILLVLLLGAILLPFVLFGLLARPMPDQVMEVRARSLVLPATSFSAELVEIPIAQVRSIYARFTGNGNVWIETSYRTFTFPLGAFESAASAALLVDRVRECIRALPDGDQRIAAIDRDARIAERALSARHPATIGAIAILIAASLLLHLGGVHELTVGSVRFGANVDFLVREGELHRLVASSFIHPTLVHLVFVVFGIASAGAIVERLLGTRGALLIMLLSGLAGAIALQAGSGLTTVGASPVLFGLLGAAAFTTKHHRGRVPMVLRPTIGVWILIGTFTLPIAIIPDVDFTANIGGLLAGVIASALFGSDEGSRSHWVAGVIGVLSALYIYGLATAVIAWREHTRAIDVRVMARAVKIDRATTSQLNTIAWRLAIDPDSSARDLDLAETAAKRAVDRADPEDVSNVEDTLATVHYRQGRFADAIAIEKKIFAAEAKPIFASQLARFLHAGTSSTSTAATARVAEGAIELELKMPARADSAAYLVAVDGDRLAGMITLPVREGEIAGRLPLSAEDAWVRKTEIRVVSMDRSRKTVAAGAWTMLPEIGELP